MRQHRCAPRLAEATPADAAPSADRPDPVEKVHPKINHVLIISEDGLRADAVATLHLKWHDLMRKRGSYSDHAHDDPRRLDAAGARVDALRRRAQASTG